MTYELKPHGYNQKSYYDKAIIIEDGNKRILQSYKTKVLEYANGKLFRLWNGWSTTTAKHINSFLTAYGLPKLTKKQWFELPIKDESKRVYTVGYSNGIIKGHL